MIRDIVLLFVAAFFAVAAGYFYLHNDNLQVCAGVIFIGTFLLAWASPKRFPVFAIMTGSSIILANIYARANQLEVPAPPAGFAEAFLAFIPAIVAGIGGMIIGGGLSKLPDKLGRERQAAAIAAGEPLPIGGPSIIPLPKSADPPGGTTRVPVSPPSAHPGARPETSVPQDRPVA